jgi:uncharacterized protein YdhG (YjbR/CyaY superfamily)
VPSVRFHRIAEHGTVGCTVAFTPDVYIGAVGADAPDALHKAADLASQLQKLAAKHPELQEAISLIPGGALAFKGLSAASEILKNAPSIAHGVEQVATKIGPAVADVAKSILSIF